MRDWQLRSALSFSPATAGLPALWAQATGTILGTVTDPTGATISGALVQATNVTTNVSRTVMTNEVGNYEIANLIPGPYAVSVQKRGFKKSLRPQFDLEIAQYARVDFQLPVGEVNETVQVEAQAPLLNTTEATMGQVVGSHETQELPLNGRNYLQLVTLAPGTTTYAGRSFYNSSLTDNSGSVVVGGMGDDRNEVSLDGVSVKAYMTNGAFVPSIEALREFKVETTPYSAELGRSGGAQIRLETKSGTNQYHGLAYEFLRNSKLLNSTRRISSTGQTSPSRRSS